MHDGLDEVLIDAREDIKGNDAHVFMVKSNPGLRPLFILLRRLAAASASEPARHP